MKNSQFDLLRHRRFAPLFITQFLGAFHDNIFKNALVALMVFGAVSGSGDQDKTIAAIAMGVFMLPFILFSALAGQYADKYPKEKVIRVVKLAEVFIAVSGALSLLTGSETLCFITLFTLGAQSAFFGPSKYSILPEHLAEDELIGGNALLNTSTFLAILIGSVLGNVLVNIEGIGTSVVSLMLLACAVSGYIASRSIPETKAASPDIKINYNIVTETYAILHNLFTFRRSVFEAALGVSWFYFIGAMFMSQLQGFTKITLHANENVFTLFMVIFAIGVAVGGLLNNRLLQGRVEAVYVPLAALGITLFSIDLFFAGVLYTPPASETLTGLGAFLGTFSGWRMIADVFLIAICGGIFVVPLNTIIQHDTPDEIRSRILAGSAILDSIFIVTSAIISFVLLNIGINIPFVILIFALANALVAIYICQLLPEYLLKTLLQGLFKLLYKVEVRGIENIKKAGNRALIVGNHVSLLDPPLLAAFLPGRPMFAVNSFVAEWVWVKPFLKLVDAFPLDPTNPFSVKSLIKEVEKDKHCVIFPEGRLTETGALMKIYEGPGMIADKSDAMILPVRLDGVQHTAFARLKDKVPLRKFPKVTITILEPRHFKIPDALTGRARRQMAGLQLYDLMEQMMFQTEDRNQTLFSALMKARYINGSNAPIAEDVERKPMTFKTLVKGAIVLGRKFAATTTRGENVGMLLPNSCATLTAFFGLQAFGRVPAMLNFSAGQHAILAACTAAQLKTVITSRKFIDFARLGDLAAAMEEQGLKLVYLEDIKKGLTPLDKARSLYAARTARLIHESQKVKPDDPAVVLFTSGSEGLPKGVVLSHANIMSNIIQLTARVDFNRQDIVFNCLPMFHSFGLTGGTLLPVLSGVRTFLYPNPLHYRIVPELVYSSNATIMFGTDTFLNGYAKKANAYDFYRMRYIFAGAEKVREETRQIYMERFGVRVLEGYGSTETSPVIACNAPMHTKPGSVGRLLAGLEYRLADVPGVDQGGRLSVKGPNVMLGYLRAENPGVLEPPPEGWYDTGDIVDIDEEGYVSILGRAKRFAKIAGEMVSLTSVETYVKKVYPDHNHAVASIPDKRKGEQLVLVTTNDKAAREDLSKYASENGISELAVPKTILLIESIPVLGTGKTDYAEIQQFVEMRRVKVA
ncbi:MAG: acyl-[ACP]--phospholipid O-acyltransferase [Alphaproteobacteria bacterium]|nr:acyl-[ACP]--phospholipid O-acyltransferase [Alphaproteobacteria bacterium]